MNYTNNEFIKKLVLKQKNTIVLPKQVAEPLYKFLNKKKARIVQSSTGQFTGGYWSTSFAVEGQIFHFGFDNDDEIIECEVYPEEYR